MKTANMNVEFLNKMGTDLTVVNAARVSFNKESDFQVVGLQDTQFPMETKVVFDLKEEDKKLIKYLAKYNHWSPFAHTTVQLRIKAPIFVARQLVKHQVGGVWNEVSRRYVDDEPEFYFPEVWRGKPVNAKQGSSGEVDNIWWIPDDSYYSVTDGVVESTRVALQRYNRMIECGVCPEQARMVLPQNTMTEWIWTGSLVFFARVCKLRLDSHSQKETQEIAQKINDIIKPLFPYSWEALTVQQDTN